MNDKAQTRLMTVLTIVVFEVLKKQANKLLFMEEVPGRRDSGEDSRDAAAQALVRVISVIIASALVRWLADRGRRE